MTRVLFQGDSITDAGRVREVFSHLGIGYPNLTTAEIGFDEPGRYEFVNRGVSGDRIIDVYARIKRDIINLKPDIMSILIGVNDVWHEIADQNGVSTQKYEILYNMLIEEVRESIQDIKIMILEPFVLKGEATVDSWDAFRTGVREKAEAARRVADKYGLPFIELQAKFDEAVKKAPESYWLSDGVHPTTAGHELIKREWIKAFRCL